MRKLENAAGRFCDIVEKPDTGPFVRDYGCYREYGGLALRS
jgi:hypothetical protein